MAEDFPITPPEQDHGELPKDSPEVLSPEDRVEELLEANAGLFSHVESQWQVVDNLYENVLKAGMGVNQYRLKNNPGTGKIEQHRVPPKAQRSSKQSGHSQQRDQELTPPKILAHINHYAHTVAEDYADVGLRLYASMPAGIDLAEAITKQTLSVLERDLSDRIYDPLDIPGVWFDKQGSFMVSACVAACVTQAVALKHIETMLSDDELAPTLIDRIQELAEEASVAPAEYPGLLETIALQVTMAESKKEKNYIEQALSRVAKQKYTEADFTQDLFERGPNDREKKTLRHFVSQVAAAQMISTGSGIDFGDKEVANRVAAYFNSDVPFADPGFITQWRNAYKERVRLATAKQASECSHALAPYLQSGRRKARVPSERPQAESPERRKRKQHSQADTEQGSRPVEELTERRRYKPAIFNSMNQAGTTWYELHEVGSIDDIMKHSVVTSFLNQHPGEKLEDDLRTYLQDIALDPKASRKVKGHPISLELQQSKSNKLRRYSPMEPATESQSMSASRAEVLAAAGGELSRRIRILYVETEREGRSHVGILQISLKDTQTYS
jgi:hypothetical protein